MRASRRPGSGPAQSVEMDDEPRAPARRGGPSFAAARRANRGCIWVHVGCTRAGIGGCRGARKFRFAGGFGCRRRDSNPRHADYDSAPALAEPCGRSRNLLLMGRLSGNSGDVGLRQFLEIVLSNCCPGSPDRSRRPGSRRVRRMPSAQPSGAVVIAVRSPRAAPSAVTSDSEPLHVRPPISRRSRRSPPTRSAPGAGGRTPRTP